MNKKTSIGGQALIEGIMMKGPQKTSIAVRLPDGGIDVDFLEQKALKDKIPFFGLPVIRGVINFVESMVTGYKALMLSADKSGYTEIEEEGKEPSKLSGGVMNAVMIVAAVLGVALAVVLFMLIPRIAVGGLQMLFKNDFSPVVRSGIEQLIKLAVFVCYVWLVSFMKDIRRVFMYHGAEHKTIFCYEKGLPLTVENIKKQKRFHPRCGTSFMILMILISVVFSTVVQIIFKGVYENALVWTLIKLLMIPIVCGAGYEVLKLCGKYDNLLTRIVSAPGVWVQHITTKEPDDSMIEIAIAAMNEVIPQDEKNSEITEKTEENDNI